MELSGFDPEILINTNTTQNKISQDSVVEFFCWHQTSACVLGTWNLTAIPTLQRLTGSRQSLTRERPCLSGERGAFNPSTWQEKAGRSLGG